MYLVLHLNLSLSYCCCCRHVHDRKQENVLAGLLLDLSLLDQYMFKFRPGTLAAASLFLARVTAAYYSKVYRLFSVCVDSFIFTARFVWITRHV